MNKNKLGLAEDVHCLDAAVIHVQKEMSFDWFGKCCVTPPVLPSDQHPFDWFKDYCVTPPALPPTTGPAPVQFEDQFEDMSHLVYSQYPSIAQQVKVTSQRKIHLESPTRLNTK